MTAKKNPARNPSRSSHSNASHSAERSAERSTEKSAPSVEGLLSMVDPMPWADESSGPAKAPGPGVGKVTGIDSQGRPLVAFPGSAAARSAKSGSSKSPAKGAPDAGSIPARSTVRVTASDTGREALIAFENGDRDKPIIIGLLQAPEELPARIELQAGKEMVLKCGPASITLTKDGRIVIRGADVLTRSSGSNRIKGGSVHIN